MFEEPGPIAPELLDFLQRTTLLGGLPELALRALAPEFERVAIGAGERLLAEGEPGDALFLLVSGRLRAVVQGSDGAEALLNEIGPGESVGEIAVLTGERRTASIYATLPSELLRLTRAQLARFERQHPAAAETLRWAIVERLQRSQLNLALHVSKVFAGLAEAIMQEIRAALELRMLRGGETLFRQGEPSDALYLVINGRLRVVREGESDNASALYELQRGQSVGEIGVIAGGPRTATVVAVRDSLVARLSRASFERLHAQHPEVMLRQFAAPVVRLLAEQAGGAARPGAAVSTIAILPIGRWEPPAGFAAQLAEALAAAGPTLHLSSGGLDALLGRPGAAQTPADAPGNLGLVRWLNEQEASHSYVVYEADPRDTHWTGRCLRQADRILLVAEAGDEPTPGAVERALLAQGGAGRTARRSLVLLHRSAARPAGTRAWLEPRQVSAHYHARLGDAHDMARLARLVTGRGVGVVLGGGGAPGFGHIGALRAMGEAGIPIDLIGGTSQGGVMACQFAMGWDHATTMAKNHAAIRHHFDYTFPVTALMAGAEMSAAMREMFGETRLEDLWIPCFCVTSNLSQAALAVHERGPIWKYTRATTSLPGILPPVVDGGELLVDGGLLNNLPTDVMRQREDCGVVIAIEASAESTARRDGGPPYEASLSGWQVLWQRLNPFAKAPRVPTMGSIMVRVAMLNDAQHVKTTRSLADFHLRLQVGAYGLLEFSALDAIVRAGYNSVSAYLAGLRDGPSFQALVGGPSRSTGTRNGANRPDQ